MQDSDGFTILICLRNNFSEGRSELNYDYSTHQKWQQVSNDSYRNQNGKIGLVDSVSCNNKIADSVQPDIPNNVPNVDTLNEDFQLRQGLVDFQGNWAHFYRLFFYKI